MLRQFYRQTDCSKYILNSACLRCGLEETVLCRTNHTKLCEIEWFYRDLFFPVYFFAAGSRKCRNDFYLSWHCAASDIS